jgi:hypothetical protein
MALHPHGQVRCEASNAQDALMIGKTSRAVAMKHSWADGAADQINRLIIASSLTVIGNSDGSCPF